MKAIHYLFVFIALLISGISEGQDTLKIDPGALSSLGSTNFMLNKNDTTNYPTISVKLYNLSNDTFSNTITFDYNIIAGGITINHPTASNADSSGINFIPQAVSINPHDSAVVSGINVWFSSPVFAIGSSTVVIWPVVYNNHVGPTIYMLDSAQQQINIVPATGITGPSAGQVKVYMSGPVLYIRDDSKNSFGDIRIYDISGELLTEQKISQYAAIPMQQYAAGIYLVELTLSDGTHGVYKVFNDNSR